MPCRNDWDNPTVTNNCDKYKDEINKWESAFCAIVSYLDKKTNLNLIDVLENASMDSKTDLILLYQKHIQADVERLEKDLNKYSEHELSIIKTLLNK